MNQTDRPQSTSSNTIRQTAEQFLSQQYPDALCAFVAGSVVRGDHTPNSDIDLVVMYDDTFKNPHRNSFSFNGWPIEVFVQNVKAQEYFFEQDRLRGMCVLANMIAEGMMIGPDLAFAEERKERAQQVIGFGPLLLGPGDIQRRVYQICDTLDDLRAPRPDGEIYGCLAELYLQLGDLYLRAGGYWSGHSKQLYRRLKLRDEKFAERYTRAFERAYKAADYRPLFAIAEEVLEPLGGFNWAGYYAEASAKWRD